MSGDHALIIQTPETRLNDLDSGGCTLLNILIKDVDITLECQRNVESEMGPTVKQKKRVMKQVATAHRLILPCPIAVTFS